VITNNTAAPTHAAEARRATAKPIRIDPLPFGLRYTLRGIFLRQ
jgi:hypothetical protein